MRILDLALKDLTQVFRDRKSLLFLVAMPILFMLFFSLIFGSQGGTRDARLPVGFVNDDSSSPLSTHLLALLEDSDAVRPVILDTKQAAKAGLSVRDGKLAAAVSVPQGFGAATLAGQPARVSVIAATNDPAGQTASNAIDAAMTRLLGSAQIARSSAQSYEKLKPFVSAAERQAYLEQALSLTSNAWRDPPLSVLVENATAQTSHVRTAQDNTDQSAAGSIVQFTIYGLIMSAGVLVLERKSGALQRLLTTTLRRWEVLAGHALAMLLVVLFQEVVLIGCGQLLMHVGYARQPLAIALVSVALALWVVSLGMLIGAVSKGEEQVIMWSLLAMFVFAALGGAWFPLEFTSKTFSAIGHLTPTAWAMDGFQNILIRGLGLSSVWLPVGILLAYAAAFFALAVWRFQFE
jgi:ABC-2 type transport system permease protein